MPDHQYNKPFGGTIRSWCRHILTKLAPEDMLREKLKQDPNIRPEFFTGEVVEDKLKRWRPGDAMRSSLIVNFDEETLLVETENTIYQLTGPGRISESFPLDYASEVGKTILLLSGDERFKIDDPSNIVVYPGSKLTSQIKR
ncbi:MAG: hypothetical protein ACJA2D_001642 [Pseudohongiellaceae bacterium]|jgi:hypothetical protein